MTQRIEIGQVWRRKSNGFLVKITDAGRTTGTGTWYNVRFDAHERQPRQPASGAKWAAYFTDAFELVLNADGTQATPADVEL